MSHGYLPFANGRDALEAGTGTSRVHDVTELNTKKKISTKNKHQAASKLICEEDSYTCMAGACLLKLGRV